MTDTIPKAVPTSQVEPDDFMSMVDYLEHEVDKKMRVTSESICYIELSRAQPVSISGRNSGR